MLKKQLFMLTLCLSLVLPFQTARADLLPIIRFAAGLLNQGVFPKSDAYTTDDDVVIETSDGELLTANVFVPNGLVGFAPAVIFINSWALNEYEYLDQAAHLAEKGYIVLSYTTRGFGRSTGQINTAGPLDMADYSQVIDYLISHYPVDPDAIGSAGISYGSGISLLGAARDSRVKAVAAMSSWGDLVEALYGNQTPRLVWGELLTLAGELTGNPEPVLGEHWDVVKNQQLDKIPEVKAWAYERSPINYVDQLNSNGTAVYLAKAYGDNLFQPNSLLDMFGQLTGPKHLDLVSGTHATAELLPALAGIGEDVIWQNVYKWFDLHLKGETNEMATAKPLQMKVKFEGRFEGFDDYPIAEADDKVFYMHPRGSFDNGDLETAPYRKFGWFDVDNTINAWAGTAFSTQIPLLSQLLEQLEIPVITNVYQVSDNRSIYFNTDWLDEEMQIRGTPGVSLQVQPHYNKMQLVAYLYDMDWTGTGRLITHGVITLPEAPWGKKIKLDFDLVSTAYDVPAGHSLVLAIDTKDPEYKSPTGVNYYVDFEFNNDRQSVLTVPVVSPQP